ncbi:MAG TPA: T9SS type A sorting domain-containing protein, partial [Bacteroidia bacterium]|nr:T9SS type A sorting domain-containing protein [Bacteroidia bacterium]
SVYIGGTNLYRSTSAFADSIHTQKIGGYSIGATLPVVNSYLNHHPDQHVLAFSPTNPQVMFSCNDGGLFKTNNDTAASMIWTPLNNGYITSMFYTVAMDHVTPGNNILVGGAQDNGSWYTNNTTLTSPWTHPGGGDGSYCAIADNQTAYYLSIQNGKTIRAQLNGSGVVTSFRRIDPIGAKGYQFINPFVIDPNNNNLMYMAGGKYMWRNNDLSTIPMNNMWDSISTNWVKFPDSVAASGSTITAVAISKTPANRLYYGTDKQKVYRIDNANTGLPTPPVNITYSGFPATGFVSCIAVDPNNADHLMVIFSNYGVYSIFYSKDGGTSWIKAAGNLESTISGTGNGPSVRWGSIMPVSNGYVYMVGTSVGIYATDTLIGTTTTSGTVWVQQGASTIGNTVCDMIDYRSSDGLVAIATHSGGIYTANITSTSDVASVRTVSKPTLGLSTFPNPFRDMFTVTFVLPEPAQVRITLYDEQGRVSRMLDQGRLPEGIHSLILQRNNLPSGIYYLGLQAGNALETRKLIIME